MSGARDRMWLTDLSLREVSVGVMGIAYLKQVPFSLYFMLGLMSHDLQPANWRPSRAGGVAQRPESRKADSVNSSPNLKPENRSTEERGRSLYQAEFIPPSSPFCSIQALNWIRSSHIGGGTSVLLSLPILNANLFWKHLQRHTQK